MSASSLLEFTVGNYRSIFEPVTLSLVATKAVSQNKQVDEQNVLPLNDDVRVLKSIMICGANASGKSTLISALQFMRRAVLTSPVQLMQETPINPPAFRLRTDAEERPSLFQVVFLIEGVRYQYGFHVRDGTIEQEWLYKTPTIREATLFERDGGKIRVGDLFKEARGLQERARPDLLFLTTCAAFNVSEACAVATWFRRLVVRPSGRRPIDMMPQYALRSKIKLERVQQLITSLDLGIANITVEDEDVYVTPFGESYGQVKSVPRVKTVHNVHTPDHIPSGVTTFDLKRDESDGTKQLFALAGPIADALRNGRTIVVDEFDAHLHSLLTKTLVQLFNCAQTNPLGAQLIFTTHDTNLLDRYLFRRDQVWFTEKDQDSATKLYSLVEFETRNDASFDSNYIRGRYGAIPYLGNFAWPESTLRDSEL